MNDFLTEKSILLRTMVTTICVNIFKKSLYQNVARQGIDSVTSVVANIAEAKCSQSRKDFIHKLSISRKELNETLSWLTYYKEIDPTLESEIEIAQQTGHEVFKLLNASITTSSYKKHN